MMKLLTDYCEVNFFLAELGYVTLCYGNLVQNKTMYRNLI